MSDLTEIFEHFSGDGDFFYNEPIKSFVPHRAWSGKASIMLFSTSATSIRWSNPIDSCGCCAQ